MGKKEHSDLAERRRKLRKRIDRYGVIERKKGKLFKDVHKKVIIPWRDIIAVRNVGGTKDEELNLAIDNIARERTFCYSDKIKRFCTMVWR